MEQKKISEQERVDELLGRLASILGRGVAKGAATVGDKALNVAKWGKDREFKSSNLAQTNKANKQLKSAFKNKTSTLQDKSAARLARNAAVDRINARRSAKGRTDMMKKSKNVMDKDRFSSWKRSARFEWQERITNNLINESKIDEGVKRLGRLARSKKLDVTSEPFRSSINKVARRNKKYLDKGGSAVDLANKRSAKSLPDKKIASTVLGNNMTLKFEWQERITNLIVEGSLGLGRQRRLQKKASNYHVKHMDHELRRGKSPNPNWRENYNKKQAKADKQLAKIDKKDKYRGLAKYSRYYDFFKDKRKE